jgi:LPXTG-motif cell wall-anchored protein
MLASVLTGALIASGAALGVAVPAQAADGPSITVTPVPRAGGSVTVTGSGFSTVQPGIYVGIRPTGGTTDSYTVWVAPGNTEGTIPGLGATAPMNADGSFRVSATVPAYTDGATYSVVTRKAHGAVDPTQNTSIPLAYEALPAVATGTTLAVSPSGTATEGAAVTLTATVSPAAAGSVEFFDGATSLGVQPVAGGSASTSQSTLVPGAHQLSAVFTPADTSTHVGSTSSPVAYTITAVPEPEPQPAPTPTLTVTPSSGLDADGTTVTVEGENFDTSAKALYGPSAGSPAGFYAQIGWVDSSWRPSEGAPSAARSNAYSAWVQATQTVSPYLKWTTNADGTANFSWTVTIDKATLDAKSRTGATLAVFTTGAGGVVQAINELAVPIAFAATPVEPEVPVEPEIPAEPEVPAITVTPATNLDPSKTNVLTITGDNYTGPGAANGAYVLFGETSIWDGSGPLPGDGWIAQGWVQPGQITDGAFNTTLTIPAGTLDATKRYQVATSAAHGLSITDRSMDAFAPVTVAAPTAPFVGFPLGSNVQPGQTLSIVGGGFAPGDVVTAVANSTPVTIGMATAPASGTVAFSWTVPADFAAGAHTVTLSVGGTVVASAPFTVSAAAVLPAVETPAVESCVAQSVTGASIQWGVKESFRSYITGPIAKGAISGGWGAGAGAYSPDTDRGRVSYTGAVHYTGHSGLLDMTLSNPRIQVNSATSASLILNVQSTDASGNAAVNASGIVFATLSLPAASESSNRISWSNASATLTAAGAEAFAGFYQAGAALDPVSFSFPLGAEVPCDSTTTGDLAATGGETSFDVMWLGAGLLALGALLVVARRRRLTA